MVALISTCLGFSLGFQSLVYRASLFCSLPQRYCSQRDQKKKKSSHCLQQFLRIDCVSWSLRQMGTHILKSHCIFAQRTYFIVWPCLVPCHLVCKTLGFSQSTVLNFSHPPHSQNISELHHDVSRRVT